MRITTLIENLVYTRNLFAEHGLSFYLETARKKILFDTGQTSHFIHNASVLGIDLTAVDAVVISHGHYDHTGGLYSFLKINKKALVYLKKEAFYPKFHGPDKFIGVQYDSIIDNRVTYVEIPVELDDGLFVMPDIPVRFPADTSFNHFKIRVNNGFIDDAFNDELYLAISEKDKLSVVSSCSHRGITNIIEAATGYFNKPLDTVLGGFHIRNCTANQLNSLIRYLENMAPKAIGICHCTGVEKYAALFEHFKEKVFYCHTGKVVLANE